MSRRRDLSTDISVDKKLKSENLSDLAALLYTWMIPHADDFCRLVAKDAEEINLLVWPNRNKTDAETAVCLEELLDAGMIGQDEDGHYFFPSTSFYKYQTKIPVDKRVQTPALRQRRPARSAEEHRSSVNSPENSDERRSAVNSPEKGVLPSPSPSHLLSPSPTGGAGAPPSRARAELVVDNDLGLGEKHPATLCGWDRWRRLEQFWKLEGKKLGIFQVECLYRQLEDIRKSGHDPGEAVEKALRCGWKDIYPPDNEPPQQNVNFDRVRALAVKK